MMYIPNYAGALRCIGQALQQQNIEVFELITRSNEFRLQGGDPNPPYTSLVELKFSLQNIAILDRDGHAQRRQSKAEIRFDSLPEILRAVGDYVDHKRSHLRRVDNSRSLNFADPAVEIEYETRAGDVQLENLAMSFICESAMRMYKKRTRHSNPISTLARQR
jgi:hypothetical protein